MKCITIVVIAVLISYTWDTLSGCRMSSCTHFSWLKKNKLKFFKNKNNKMCGVVSQSSSSNSEWASWSGSLQFIFSIERERGKNSLWLLHQHFVCHVLLLFHSKKKNLFRSRFELMQNQHILACMRWWSVKAAIKSAHKRASLSRIMLSKAIIRTYQWHYSEELCTTPINSKNINKSARQF